MVKLMSEIYDLAKRNPKIIAIALIAVIALSFSGSLLSILVPGAEGVRALNYGVQFANSGSVLKPSTLDQLPAGYSWGSNQAYVMTITRAKTISDWYGTMLLNGPSPWYAGDSGGLKSEVKTPEVIDVSQTQTLGVLNKPETLTYYKYVQTSPTTVEIHKSVVEIKPVDFVIQISSVPGAGLYTWKDVNLWYTLDTVTWMNAYASSPPPDPNPLTNSTTKYISGNVRGAFPILGWISEYKDWTWTDPSTSASRNTAPDDNAVNFVQLNPDLTGRFISLYTSPTSTYDLALSQDVLNNQDLVNQALNPANTLPDPRFAQTVYTHIDLNSFGPYVKPTGVLGSYSSFTVWYPSVYYKIRMVYAFYGEYVYLWTDERAASLGYNEGTWQIREPTVTTTISPFDAFLNGISTWLQNPFNLIGLSGFVALLFFGAVAIVLFWLFGLPKKRGRG